ncbi:hypothetical protein [Polyangium jinanense]|uniref:Lipoprotein n=1 Tax=Polyangium jinanense TaxID=2829994 RepID=A0A9X3X024_9BACT|nr:hypothetical protein [Polyangium jinanense]MDC3955248.1 hypothetical protein [Polyangium jinanense]MDC3981549.1 hypothetical protein [Polyangium jinanense]
MKHLLWMGMCLLLGCEGGAGSPSDAPASAASQASPAADTDIAVPADYEDKAAREITTDNYKKELDDLERQVEK